MPTLSQVVEVSSVQASAVDSLVDKSLILSNTAAVQTWQRDHRWKVSRGRFLALVEDLSLGWSWNL